MKTVAYAVMAAAAAVAAMPAGATITLVDGNMAKGENVLFNNGVQTGTTVVGATQDGTIVNFTGTTVGGANVIRAQGGQARIEGALASNRPADGTLALSSLNFSLEDGTTFNNLSLNVFGGGATRAMFDLVDNEGTTFSFDLALGNGQNRFGFVGIDGQSIASVSATFNGSGIADVRQIRLDETVAVAAVPEPATWGMMLVGFGMVGAGVRRRKSTLLAA